MPATLGRPEGSQSSVVQQSVSELTHGFDYLKYILWSRSSGTFHCSLDLFIRSCPHIVVAIRGQKSQRRSSKASRASSTCLHAGHHLASTTRARSWLSTAQQPEDGGSVISAAIP